MPIGQFFSSLLSSPQSKTHCQPSPDQRRQNQKLTEQLQSLNPQSIRKQHGCLDQRYQKVIQQASIESVYRIEKYMKQFRGLLETVDRYCAENKAHKYGDKIECVQEMDALILEKFQKPFIKGQLNLYKTANLCLIKGQSMNQCIQNVKKENLSSLQNSLHNLQQLVNNHCN